MLIYGAKAIAKAQALFGQGRLVSVAVDPEALRGAPLHVVAFSDGQEAVLIDALRTPKLGELFSTAEPLAAYDAKMWRVCFYAAISPAQVAGAA